MIKNKASQRGIEIKKTTEAQSHGEIKLSMAMPFQCMKRITLPFCTESAILFVKTGFDNPLHKELL